MSFEVRPNQHSFLKGESPDYLIRLLSVPLCGCLYLIRGLDVPLESLGLTPSRPYEPKVLVVLFQPVVQSMSKSQDHANEALWCQVSCVRQLAGILKGSNFSNMSSPTTVELATLIANKMSRGEHLRHANDHLRISIQDNRTWKPDKLTICHSQGNHRMRGELEIAQQICLLVSKTVQTIFSDSTYFIRQWQIQLQQLPHLTRTTYGNFWTYSISQKWVHLSHFCRYLFIFFHETDAQMTSWHNEKVVIVHLA